MTGDTNIAFQANPADKTAALLQVINVDNLALAEAQIRGAGGDITLAPFAFPGGRRFHFRDPDGHKLAVMQAD